MNEETKLPGQACPGCGAVSPDTEGPIYRCQRVNCDVMTFLSRTGCVGAKRVTYLKCDHIGWGMNAIVTTPVVGIMCAASVAWQSAQFLAGCALGVWLSMWLVVLWAWLTRRQPQT